jgi:hypothetical protein
VVYTHARFRTFPNSGTWNSVVVTLPDDVVPCDINLEEQLTPVISLEEFCLISPAAQYHILELMLKGVLGDASELAQIIVDRVSGIVSKVRLGQVVRVYFRKLDNGRQITHMSSVLFSYRISLSLSVYSC